MRADPPGPRGTGDVSAGTLEVSRIPALADFLKLYIARHQRGEGLARAEIALKRERLVEAPRRLRAQERQDRSQQILLAMQTFREQHVPGALLHSHLAERLERHELKTTVRMPCCIGAFPYDQRPLSLRQTARVARPHRLVL